MLIIRCTVLMSCAIAATPNRGSLSLSVNAIVQRQRKNTHGGESDVENSMARKKKKKKNETFLTVYATKSFLKQNSGYELGERAETGPAECLTDAVEYKWHRSIFAKNLTTNCS